MPFSGGHAMTDLAAPAGSPPLDNPHAPEVFADGVAGFFNFAGNIRITLEALRVKSHQHFRPCQPGSSRARSYADRCGRSPSKRAIGLHHPTADSTESPAASGYRNDALVALNGSARAPFQRLQHCGPHEHLSWPSKFMHEPSSRSSRNQTRTCPVGSDRMPLCKRFYRRSRSDLILRQR